MWKELHCLQEPAGVKIKTWFCILTRRGNFIYNTGCWQGIFSSAYIIQGWSARLCINWTVVWKSWLQWHYKHTLETSDSFSVFFFRFLKKIVQTTIQNICAVGNLQKKSWDFVTVQFFFLLSPPSFVWNNVSAPDFHLDSGLRHAGCTLVFVVRLLVIELTCQL